MKWLRSLVADPRRAWLVVIAASLISAGALYEARRVGDDPDLLAFLPQESAEVRTFKEITSRFGGLDVAVIGVEAKDPFEPAFFARLRAATKSLNESAEIHLALSLANVEDQRPAEGGGIETDLLVRAIPDDAAAREKLRAYVMSKDLVVGQLIGPAGHAVLIYCFGRHGTDPRAFSARIRSVMNASMPGDPIYWGGAPFVSSYLEDVTRSDLTKLTPWGLAVVVLLVLIGLRDPIAAGLALLPTGVGLLWTIGLMGLFGTRFNLVLSSMPLILFSVGGAYGLHVVARYQDLARTMDRERALAEMLCQIAPASIAAGLATAGALLAFLLMDVAPMRSLGAYASVGILITVLLSLTLVPAAIRIVRLAPARTERNRLNELVVPLVSLIARRRLIAGIGISAVGAGALVLALGVDPRMDTNAFLAPGSEPEQANAFLLRHFDGSLFLQVQVVADVGDPLALNELQRVADRITLLPGVSSVRHIGEVIAEINQAMEGERRIPDDAEKLKLLYGLLAGRRALAQLVTSDRTQALMHVRLRSTDTAEVEATLRAVEQIASIEAIGRYTSVRSGAGGPADALRLDRLIARIGALAKQHGAVVDAAAIARLRDGLTHPAAPVLAAAVVPELVRFLRSGECFVDLSGADGSGDPAHRVAEAVAALGPSPDGTKLRAAILGALAGVKLPDVEVDAALADDLAASLETPLAEIDRRLRNAALADRLLASAEIKPPEGERGRAFTMTMAHALSELDAPVVMQPLVAGVLAGPDAPAARTFEVRVSGLPVIDHALSRSAARNLLIGLVLGLAIGFVVLSVLLASPLRGLAAIAPAGLTIAAVYGGMGAARLHLDLGTAMLPSMILGASVGHAVHLLAAWQGPEAGVRAAGRAIWTGTFTASAGFFLLTLGEALTLRSVGGLIAIAMLAAAAATFLTVPVLAKPRACRRAETPQPVAAAAPNERMLEERSR